MKIEKHGNKYRVRKMYKGAVYILYFDKEPDEKDIAIVMIQRPKLEMLNKNDIVNDLDELDTKIKSF